MLNRLPLELVRHIVFLTLPSSSSFTKYRERQTPLLALCLTSRTLRVAAQPILFQSVSLYADEPGAFLDVVEADKALGEHVRALRLHGSEDVAATNDRIFSYYAKPCPNVVEIMLYCQFANLQSLEVFPHLERLACSHGILRTTLPLRLPRLQELSLMCTTTSRFSTLPAVSLPSLRALHVQCIQIGVFQPEGFEFFKPDSVAWSCGACDIMYHAGLSVQQHVLHDCATEGLARLLGERKRAKHLRALRLNPFTGDNTLNAANSFPTLERMLNDCLSLLRQLEDPAVLPNLKAIYLPTAYTGRKFDFLDPISSEGFSFRLLKRNCAAREIELVFEDLPHPYYDSMISQEFVKRYWLTKAKREKDVVRALSGRMRSVAL